MSYSPRSSESAVSRLSAEFPALLVVGPRQVGKTTLLRHLCDPHRAYVTLDDPTLRQLATEDPALLLLRFPPPILIDEIQYAPQLLPIIKMGIDTGAAPGAFWLTGSQQFHLMKGVSESLAGRVAILNLLGFSSRERHGRWLDLPAFLPDPARMPERIETGSAQAVVDLYHDIWTGAFPALSSGAVTDWEVFHSSYFQTYLQRDVRDLASIGDEIGFVRFVRACAARTGQLLNLSELARDADVSVATAGRWLSVLEASFQVFLLQPYHTSVTKRLVKAPKLYFLDTGLCSFLTEWSSARTLESGAMSGAIFETFVLGEILKSWWHQGRRPHLYYYRDRDTREVDFLFEQDGTLFAMEVKKSATPRREWAGVFTPLRRLDPPLGGAVVACLSPLIVPLADDVAAVPIGVV